MPPDSLTLLNLARRASQERNWSLVNQTLQQLPLEAESEATAAILALALEVLKAGDFQQRWEVSQFLPKLGQPAIPALIEILQDRDLELETRWFSGRILSHYPQPRAILALAQLLQADSPAELRMMASKALADMGEIAIYPLVDLLEVPETRLLTVQALAQIRRPGIIAPLLSVTGDPSPVIRALAIEALGSFQEPRILTVLLKAIQDSAASVRKEALQALGYQPEATKTKELVSAIAPLLRDPQPEVGQQAAMTLGRIASQEAASALFNALSSAPAPLKKEIVKALGWMDIPEALGYLGAALQETGEMRLCQEIIAVLGRKGASSSQKQVAQMLLNFFHSQHQVLENVQIKQRLATALGEVKQPEAKPVLAFLSQDPDAQVRLHAQAALRKISALDRQS